MVIKLKTTLLPLVLVALVLLLSFVSFSTQQTYYTDDVFVKNLKLYVEGKEFFIKAVAYNPVPLGILNMTSTGFEGTGYCSPKKTVFGEYKSGCFGSDYFDGVIDKTRFPPGPQTASGAARAWWSEIWERDLKNMKDLGVNTIRIYNLNMITKTFLDMYPNEYTIIDKNVAAQHVPFLDAAHAAGFKVILPIVTDQTFLQTSSDDRINKHIEAAVTELGDHPALLMWCLGNEMEIKTNETLLNLVNEKIKLVRTRTKALHNRMIPVTHAVIDYPDYYEKWAQELDVDVFTTNAGYRDTILDPLWVGENYQNDQGEIVSVPGWKVLSQKYGKPLFIGEMGMHQQGSEITDATPDWFNEQYKQIVSHVADGCIGTCFFEYIDEVNKPELQKTMGIFAPEVTIRDGLSSVEMNNFIPDTLTQKNHIYKAIAEGEAGSYTKYNYNANVFTLLNREQTTVTVQPRTSGSTSSSPSPNPSSTPSTSHSHSPKPNDSNKNAVAISLVVLALSAVIGYLVL